MEIVISGRRVDIAERFRQAAHDKLAKIEALAARPHRVDVELTSERNPRQSHTKRRVEITLRGKGPVIRAEASGEDSLIALDAAVHRLMERLRRQHDKRRVHHGRHSPRSVRNPQDRVIDSAELLESLPSIPTQATDSDTDAGEVQGDGSPMIIRFKDHEAAPMTVDQALYEMELVGHDFYLFQDADCGRPSVVYRRKGWDYGVIRLDVTTEASNAEDADAVASAAN